jgi:hypothetical protein
MIRLSAVVAILLVGAAALALYQLKYQVAGLEAEHARLARELAAEREALHVLGAEWAYLNQPHRLADLATRHLDLVPLGAESVITLIDLPPRAGALAVAPADAEAAR